MGRKAKKKETTSSGDGSSSRSTGGYKSRSTGGYKSRSTGYSGGHGRGYSISYSLGCWGIGGGIDISSYCGGVSSGAVEEAVEVVPVEEVMDMQT
ncbi:uncharacterized protein [Watersipora subatra]|uniref:uncharacterized protein isoform X2 n=1 Tax=Watersipora subatra TaxID=2589382 RepID=UPI00355C650C